jgi:hypothetical protein
MLVYTCCCRTITLLLISALVCDLYHHDASQYITMLSCILDIIQLPAPGTPAIPTPPAGTAVVTNLGATGTCQSTLKPFVWTDDGTAYLTGTLKIGALQYSNKYGETRTRGYNGGIPGPTITMEACKKYKLTLINDMSGWPNAPGAGVNGAQ